MKNKIQLMIIPILMIFTLACTVPVSMYEFFGRTTEGEDAKNYQAKEEDKYGFEVVPDPTSAPVFDPTLPEMNIQGIHSYRIEGYNNIAFGGNEWVTTGQAEVLFDNDGVRYRYIESGMSQQFIERTSENHFQHLDEEGHMIRLWCWDEGFEFETISATGTTVRLTFYLDE